MHRRRDVADPQRPRGVSSRARWIRRGGWVAGAVLLSLLTTFALPIQEWRTGEPAAPTFTYEATDLSRSGPAGLRVWVDTDAACGTGWLRDPDDCLAILELVADARITVAGITTSFGNAPLNETDGVTRALIGHAAAQGLAAPPVFRGCGTSLAQCLARGGDKAATTALRESASANPLTYLALGPLTNLAAAIQQDPTLARRIERVVAVMGRRPGHRFHPTEGRSRRGILFGHGPVFSDLNVAMDSEAVVVVQRAGVRLDLVPYAVARQQLFTRRDLEILAATGSTGQWVSQRSMTWLRFWEEVVGLDGFYPFDLMAARYVLEPGRFRCAQVDTWVADDPMLNLFDATPSLLVAQDARRLASAPSGRARYCDALEPAAESMRVQVYRLGGPAAGADTAMSGAH